MADVNELDKKVSVLEVEVSNVKGALENLSTLIDKNNEITSDIKTRLDKQNGLIPHMSEGIKHLMNKQEAVMEQVNQNSIKETATRIKVTIVWGFITAVGAGTFGFLLKTLLM